MQLGMGKELFLLSPEKFYLTGDFLPDKEKYDRKRRYGCSRLRNKGYPLNHAAVRFVFIILIVIYSD